MPQKIKNVILRAWTRSHLCKNRIMDSGQANSPDLLDLRSHLNTWISICILFFFVLVFLYKIFMIYYGQANSSELDPIHSAPFALIWTFAMICKSLFQMLWTRLFSGKRFPQNHLCGNNPVPHIQPRFD